MKSFITTPNKKILMALIAGILVIPGIVLAQLTVPQGGTGQTSFTTDQIIYGDETLRLGSEAAFTYDPDTNRLTVVNASGTNITVAGYISFDSVVGTAWSDFCTAITGGSGLCDGTDDTSAGGGDNVSVDGGAVVDPDFVSTGDIDFVNTSNTITANINAGSIVNADVNASAAIGYSKLNLSGSIIETDLDGDVAPTDGDFLQYDSTGTNFTWRSAAETRADLSLEVGTDVQAYDAQLASIAGLTPASSLLIGNGLGGYEMVTPANFITNNNILDTADIGASVQAYDADLAAIAALANTDSNFIVGNGSTWVAESGSTVRTSLGLGSLATLSSINNSNWSGTDLSVANGGTGASTFTTGGVLYGNGTSAFANSGVLTNGQLLIGDGSGAPTVAAITQGTGMTVTNGAGSITLATTLGTAIDTSEITDDTITHADIADADQTSTMCIYIEDPTADDDLNSIWSNKTANDFLLTELWAESDQTVNLDLQVDDGTPADVNGTDISPAAGEAEDTTLSGDTTVAAGEELDLAITSVSGTPTWVSICWTGNWVD